VKEKPVRKTLTIAGIVLVVAAAGILAQQMTAGHHKTSTTAPTTAPAQFANIKCPIMGSAIDPAKVTPALTREFKGQKVAFCCGECPPQWDKLSDKEKQAKLDAVKAPATSTQPAEKSGCCCGSGCCG
jgi:hypothetical protein